MLNSLDTLKGDYMHLLLVVSGFNIMKGMFDFLNL